jgi:hypothetical protein
MKSAELLYLELLKGCLTRMLFPDKSLQPGFPPVPSEYELDKRQSGFDWPSEAETMIGMYRLNNVQNCATDVLRAGVPGDFIETGVWRGGASILMRATLAAFGDTSRRVWVADSFQGLPAPDPSRFPVDADDRHWELKSYLSVPVETVKSNFERYGLLDEQVVFLPGWFKDTLPSAPVEKIALLRLDGDMYESTFEALTFLYPKLTPGGYVIIDDYGALPTCKSAVHDYRAAHRIDEEIRKIDWTGVYWQKRS